jgi:hypothetical protein
MIDIYRVVESQPNSYAADATDNNIEKAKQLEILLQRNTEDLRKKYADWDKLIRGPFLYSIPVAMKFQARFKPPGSDKTVFYGSRTDTTALFEHAYHFMQERLHLSFSENGNRTLFSVGLDNKIEYRIHNDTDIQKIMNPDDYSASHSFISTHSGKELICYPSCRDPKQGDCYAVFSIHLLEKVLKTNMAISFIWDAHTGEIYWSDLDLKISKHIFFKEQIKLSRKKRNLKKAKPRAIKKPTSPKAKKVRSTKRRTK